MQVTFYTLHELIIFYQYWLNYVQNVWMVYLKWYIFNSMLYFNLCHLDNTINNFQELQVCPSSINIEEVTQKTVNILTNRFGFQPIGQLFNNSANSCTDLKNIRSGIKSGYYWIYSRGLSSRKYCNFQWLKLDLNVVKYLIFLLFFW